MRAWGLLLLAAASAVSACRSAAELPRLPHPYKVVLLPIEGAGAALAEKPGTDDVALSLTPQQFEDKIRDRVRDSRVFSEIVVATAADLSGAAAGDEMQAASDLARRTSSDLILRIEVKSARMTDLGNNSSTFWSTFTWFMIPAPTWFVDDRSYATDIAVQASLYDPADPVKPTASVVAKSDKQDLDLWDRGLSPFVVVVPPAFLKGSAESVSEALTERAIDQMLAALVEELRTREIPSRFEMEFAEDAGGVVVSVVSRRRLRSLDVEAAGKVLASWAETGLVEEKESSAERFVYRRSVKVPNPAGTQVRVIAEDEAGGREVRTLVTTGARR